MPRALLRNFTDQCTSLESLRGAQVRRKSWVRRVGRSEAAPMRCCRPAGHQILAAVMTFRRKVRMKRDG